MSPSELLTDPHIGYLHESRDPHINGDGSTPYVLPLYFDFPPPMADTGDGDVEDEPVTRRFGE